jgi:hypothetical protein
MSSFSFSFLKTDGESKQASSLWGDYKSFTAQRYASKRAQRFLGSSTLDQLMGQAVVQDVYKFLLGFLDLIVHFFPEH